VPETPVSGSPLHVREATGADEIVVLEPGRSPVATVMMLADRLVTDAQGESPVWDDLPAVDVGAIALTIRQAWLGERIHTDARCPNPGCRERMDIAFEIPAYLAHHRPKPCPGVAPAPDSGWFKLANAVPAQAIVGVSADEGAEGAEASASVVAGAVAGAAVDEPADVPVLFRLPTIGDLRVALSSPDPEECLRERCVRPASVPADVAHRVSEAMEALAPSLGGTVTMECPACGGSAELGFDPVSYSLTELRAAAVGLYEEVHLLASTFHWSEDAILALRRSRRTRYADLIRRDRAAA